LKAPGADFQGLIISILTKHDCTNSQIEHTAYFVGKILSLDHHMRNLRTIINYFTNVVKLIPKEYEYPFGNGGFTISTYFPAKQVLKEPEIKSIVELKEFKTKRQEFARDVWVFLYRCNGANFADLLRMKWNQINGDYIFFTRKKTETTRKNNKKPIIVPLTDKLKESIARVGDKNSPFLLGLLKEGYDESFFMNRNHKIKQQINQNLKIIKDKLNLSQPLSLGSARDCYASTLQRNKVSRDDIGQMLGHNNSAVTEHYLDGLDSESTFGINETIM
jgi:integrase